MRATVGRPFAKKGFLERRGGSGDRQEDNLENFASKFPEQSLKMHSTHSGAEQRY